jgi:hypothetical protein
MAPPGYRAEFHACRFAPGRAAQGHSAPRGSGAARSARPGPGHQRRANRWG